MEKVYTSLADRYCNMTDVIVKKFGMGSGETALMFCVDEDCRRIEVSPIADPMEFVKVPKYSSRLGRWIHHAGIVSIKLCPRSNIPTDLKKAYEKGQISLMHVSQQYVQKSSHVFLLFMNSNDWVQLIKDSDSNGWVLSHE